MGRGVVDRAGREVATEIDKEILNRGIIPPGIIPQICCGFDWKRCLAHGNYGSPHSSDQNS